MSTHPLRRQTFRETPAAWVHEHGITVGARLRGDEGRGPETIEITAIGRESVLAAYIECGRENSFTFAHRDWEVVS